MKGFNTVEILTPTNVKEAKKKWLFDAKHGQWQTPQLNYDLGKLRALAKQEAWMQETVYPWQFAASNLREHRVDELLRRRHEIDMLLVAMAGDMLRGSDKSGIEFGKTYGQITEATYREALQFASDLAPQGKKFLSAKRNSPVVTQEPKLLPRDIEALKRMEIGPAQLANIFNYVLDQYGFGNWCAVLDDQATAIDVRPESVKYDQPVIVVPSHRKPVDGRKALELVRHEIECHVRDFENCWSLLPELGSDVDDAIHEGHAMYEEMELGLKLFGERPRLPQPWYVIALYEYAELGNPVSAVAQHLYDLRLETLGSQGDADRKARAAVWTILYRTIFRGRVTASSRYALYKDKAYFEGYLAAQELHETGHEAWLNLSMLNRQEIWEEIRYARLGIDPEQQLPFPDRRVAYNLPQLLLKKSLMSE